MSENPAQPKIEAPSPEQVATRQFMDIRRLYDGIIQGTTVENRREIANHYTWEKRKGSKGDQTGSRGASFYRHRKYDPAGLLHNWQTMFDPQNAYDLADEFLISEAGLVRDTLFFHDRWERFNGLAAVFSSEEDAEVPPSINPEILANAIELSLKFELLRNKQFDHDLENPNVPIGIVDHHGKLINEKGEDGSHRFIQIMEDLDRSLARLANDKRTKALYLEAINTLAYQTNKKLRRLGIDKGLAQVAGSPVFGTATVVGGIKAAVLQADKGTPDQVVRIIKREPVVPKPHKPDPVDTTPKSKPAVQIINREKVSEKIPTKEAPVIKVLRTIDNIPYDKTIGKLGIARTSDGKFRAIFTYPSGKQIETFDYDQGEFLEVLRDQFNVVRLQRNNDNTVEKKAETTQEVSPLAEVGDGVPDTHPPTVAEEELLPVAEPTVEAKAKEKGTEQPGVPAHAEETPTAHTSPDDRSLISKLIERRQTPPEGAIPTTISDENILTIGGNISIGWVEGNGFQIVISGDNETIQYGLLPDDLEKIVDRYYPGLPLTQYLIALYNKANGNQTGFEPPPYYKPPSPEKPKPKPTFRERALRVLRDFLP